MFAGRLVAVCVGLVPNSLRGAIVSTIIIVVIEITDLLRCALITIWTIRVAKVTNLLGIIIPTTATIILCHRI